MSVKDWKFHDFDMLLDHPLRFGREVKVYPVVYRLTHLRSGSLCILLPYSRSIPADEKGRWIRVTRNEGMKGSTRYSEYPNLDAAMDACIKWARRKDEEAAAR